MSILIDKSTRLLVQGITGRDGHFHAVKMKEYGTIVVGGTSPGKGGSTVDGLPVFNTMYEAVEQTQANASILFVPASYAADAIMEAADAAIDAAKNTKTVPMHNFSGAVEHAIAHIEEAAVHNMPAEHQRW